MYNTQKVLKSYNATFYDYFYNVICSLHARHSVKGHQLISYR